MKETWYAVQNQISLLRIHIDIKTSNEIMNKIHKLFIIEHKNKIEFYNNEKIMLRKQKGYLTKKINKLRKSNQQL